MFTGLIERVGALIRQEERGEGAALSIAAAGWTDPLVLGESVAVEGVCLTITSISPTGFTCDVLRETLSRTTLGRKRPGSKLNLERALRPDGRLGGHFVSGHVDGVGELVSVNRAGPDWVMTIEGNADLIGGIVFKGSIAVNGVSLTIARLGHSDFDVHLIPHTWEVTTLHEVRSGDPVNLETDMLGKYVKGFMERSKPITMERLGEAGFL